MNVNNMIGKLDLKREAEHIAETDNQTVSIQDVRSAPHEPSTNCISPPQVLNEATQNAALFALRKNTCQQQIGKPESIITKNNNTTENTSTSLGKAKKNDEQHAIEWNALMSEKIKTKIKTNNDFEQAKERKAGFTKQKMQLEEILNEHHELFTQKEIDELKWKMEKAGLYESRVQARMDIITKPAQVTAKAEAKASKNLRVRFAEDQDGSIAAQVRTFQPIRIIPAPITRTIMDALNIGSTELTDEQIEDLGVTLVENENEILADLSIVARVILPLDLQLNADNEQLSILALTLIELNNEPQVDKLYESARASISSV